MPPSVYEYFSRAMRRPAQVSIDNAEIIRHSVDGSRAIFSIEVIDDRVAIANYRCTTCVTLVALCEHLSELIRGRTRTEALSITPDDLLASHAEIPAERRDRALLAVEAMHSALQIVFKGGSL